MKLFKSKKPSAEVGVSKRGGRHNSFHIRRFTDDHGFHIYALENKSEGRRIFVPRFIFGPFRAAIRMLMRDEIARDKPRAFEYPVSFLDRDYFFLKSSNVDLDNLIIQDIDEREGSSGYITVGRRSLQTLDKLLYSDKLQHPNDVLEEIISYHKLFQFSFVKGSKSITSSLQLRKDVLQKIEPFTPRLAQKAKDEAAGEKSKEGAAKAGNADGQKKTQVHSLYGPRLGERSNAKNIKVDYEEVFGDKPPVMQIPKDPEKAANEPKSKTPLPQFPVPMDAADYKRYDQDKYFFELSTAEATDFRDRFINDRSADFFLGFEMVDALFTQNRVLKTFRFPLYYTKVRIREAGRRVYVESRENGKFHLNHLALANLVERFSDSNAVAENLDKFFKTLLAQDISVDSLNDRICVTRYLPIKEEIFDRTREILFGYQDENGKGGILSELTVQGIECDLQSVYLYRAPKLLNPIEQALERDLDKINHIAHHSMRRFYRSLLGQFLIPEQPAEDSSRSEFAPLTWIPGAMPRSSRKLIDRLNDHDLVLLEGPPGTGKTHTIMNLLIHAINCKQRILIVSDQQAAIEALIEKMEGYIVGKDRGTPAERKWIELLHSAIKVVDDVETGEQSLQDLLKNLTKAISVQELAPGSSSVSGRLEKRLRAIKGRIDNLTQGISLKMLARMGEDTPFDRRIMKKSEADTALERLVEFLAVLQGKSDADKRLIDTFVENRFSLVKQGLKDCYHFFKIPSKGFEHEVQTLKDDKEILNSILEKKVKSVEAFNEITNDYPRHELIRYLETVIMDQTSTKGKLVARFSRKMRAIFRSPLLVNTRALLHMVSDQITLLEMGETWSDQLWQLLREIHEAVRIGENPNTALSFYRSLQKQGGLRGSAEAGATSIQGDLEEIDDLYSQHDEIVKRRLVESLREIVHGAMGSRKGSGTNRITSILALIDSMKQFNTLRECGSSFEDLTQRLYETFPIWVVRKQVVPFLLPCVERSFDLVVIDEATQCRVEDSLPLMFRAKKMMVVGDDKQTVLKKESVIDDYLFKDHELDEHLRSTQARGFKGGGSNIFALVKSIKQATVMLDEHYRCPPAIIEFSNKYVYGDELKVMQWSLPEHESAVEINYNEEHTESSKKPSSGKFKGIETELIDRFLEYVIGAVKKIERRTGQTIDVEKDIAICYFLLKNEPYVKFVKDDFLRRLKRGEDVLDGAGAALQGKERDYMFYLWDVTRYNMGAFKQGDDADKRKGELNVLMSRPKKKAFHYLGRNFDQLDHSRTNITRFLWNAHMRQAQGKGRSVGGGVNGAEIMLNSALGRLLQFTLDGSSKRSFNEVRQNIQRSQIDFRKDIVVGDAERVVDLIAFPAGSNKDVVGMVDLSDFGCLNTAGQNVVDYYFQLRRAAPSIDPVFMFPQELVDENCQTFRTLMHKLEQIDVSKVKPRQKRAGQAPDTPAANDSKPSDEAA